MCQQLSLGLRALAEAEEPRTTGVVPGTVPAAALPVAAAALPHPDAWLGRVARAPALAAAGRAASYAGHRSTNPFLTPTPAPL